LGRRASASAVQEKKMAKTENEGRRESDADSHSDPASASKRILLKAGWAVPAIAAVSLPKSGFTKNVSGSLGSTGDGNNGNNGNNGNHYGYGKDPGNHDNDHGPGFDDRMKPPHEGT
jgi:hypothetical protein